MKNYLKFPLPTTATWFRLPERVKALEETGVGSQDLQSVTDQDNTTTNNIELLDTSKILFDNGSRLQKGTTNSQTGGNGGISQICSIDYELKWEAGRQYVMDSNGFTIREVNHTFTLTPGVNDDSTRGFVPDSRWILDNGDIYLCTDNTEGAAVWELIFTTTPKYKEYVAILTQTGTSAPTATIISNTLGAVTFSRFIAGFYNINSSSLFTTNKTFVSVPNSTVNTGNISLNNVNITSNSVIALETYNTSGVRTEGTMLPNQIPIEIRVYN